ncbi:curli-like amyloid fiber formation chaperone CsgH [Oceaniglobus ichthyenteri]|uniref:curli-like amyloid fiber formation chaperone CsgH n=1 Tax=Oceaniglobus ichthyenteri TaxID=2136177 RepID=UPI000D3656E6|nr:curli-like amyloid fiber formation chaperone CsgH [Oceaniglobus ichthyenteri]
MTRYITLVALTFFIAGMGRAPAPLTGIECTVVAQTVGDTTTYRGRIIAQSDTAGQYSIQIARKTANIATSSTIGGTFTAAAGQEVFVGRATHTGDLTGVMATMTITVGDKSHACDLVAETET